MDGTTPFTHNLRNFTYARILTRYIEAYLLTEYDLLFFNIYV
jgi:hypothetical protein